MARKASAPTLASRGTTVPRPRVIAVCPVCAALSVRPTREAAREADRTHWRRSHERVAR